MMDVEASAAQAKAAVSRFNAELRNFAKQVAPQELRDVKRKIGMKALYRLILKTPVDTGRARANWQVTLNVDSNMSLERTDKSGGPTLVAGEATLSNVKAHDVIYITNNVAYIEVLENGHSKQAPAGMLAVTVEELRGLFP